MTRCTKQGTYLLSLNEYQFCCLQWACYGCHALRCHFCAISMSKQPYLKGQIVIIYKPWTCHELEKFLSWITPAHEPMSLGVQGITTGHTPWTCGQNGTVVYIIPRAQPHVPFVVHSVVFPYIHFVLVSSSPVVHPAMPLAPFGCCQVMSPG